MPYDLCCPTDAVCVDVEIAGDVVPTCCPAGQLGCFAVATSTYFCCPSNQVCGASSCELP